MSSANRLPAMWSAIIATPVMFRSGSGEAFDEPAGDGVDGGDAHDDRNRAGCLLRRLNGRRAGSDDDVDAQRYELGRECGELIELASGLSDFQDDVLTFDVADSRKASRKGGWTVDDVR